MITAVVPLNMEVKHSFVVETSTTRTHQRWQPEMVQQGMEYQPCQRHEILVKGLTFLKKIDCFHGPVPDILTLVNVFESIGTDLATVQAYQVQSALSVNMLLHICKITPHPREKRNTEPRLTNSKLTAKATRCYSYGIVKTEKCELNTPQDKLEIPTEHTLEDCVWWPVLPLALFVEPAQACEWDRSCFYKEIISKIVYENISVKITGSDVRVRVWCRSTWGILTNCEVVAGAVPQHPIRQYAEQS